MRIQRYKRVKGQTWEVPRHDLTDHSDRLVAGVGELSLRRLDGLPLYLVSPTCVVLDRLDGHRNVSVFCPVEGLSCREVPIVSIERGKEKSMVKRNEPLLTASTADNLS